MVTSFFPASHSLGRNKQSNPVFRSKLVVATKADEFLALPGLWKTTYEVEGASPESREPRVVWHCVDEQADPWVSFAQLQDLPGMTCSRSSLQRNSTSLKWKAGARRPARVRRTESRRSPHPAASGPGAPRGPHPAASRPAAPCGRRRASEGRPITPPVVAAPQPGGCSRPCTPNSAPRTPRSSHWASRAPGHQACRRGRKSDAGAPRPH